MGVALQGSGAAVFVMSDASVALSAQLVLTLATRCSEIECVASAICPRDAGSEEYFAAIAEHVHRRPHPRSAGAD